MLLISVFSGNMKFGSSGECVTNEISNSIPPQKINNPKISANLFPAKFINKFDVFFKYVVITYLNYFGKGAKWNN